jgi:uncharacterized protein YdhG (YjbR/CyaY superfamily)
MLVGMKTYTSITAYINDQPKAVQGKLKEMRLIVEAAAPHVSEAIKYGMPAYVGNKDIVYFAAMKNHLGFYPTPSAVSKFATELSKFSTSKGCIRFPYETPLPKTLITKIVKFRVGEDRKLSK